MILNQSQAHAVADAMLSIINNICAKEIVVKLGRDTTFSATSDAVHVKRFIKVPYVGHEHEHYDSQDAFLTAYNLN